MSLKQFTALSALALVGASAVCAGPARPMLKPSIGASAGFGRPFNFLDADKGGLSGAVAKAMDGETDPEKKLLAGVKAAGAQYDDLTQKIDQWHGDTKKAAEDFTKAKNDFNGLSDSVKSLEQAMAKFRMQIAGEKRMAYGDPIARIIQDDEQRLLLNAQIRALTRQELTKAMKEAIENATKALSEGSTPGSTMINQALAKNIYDLLPEYGIWNTLAVEPVGTLTNVFPVDTADPLAQFIDEAGAIGDDSTIAGTSVTATVKKIAVLLKISRELLQDSEFDVTSRVLKKFARAIAYRMDFAAFRGDGTADATNGGATGIFNFGTAATAATGNTTMETLDFEDFTRVLLTPGVQALSRSSRWWMHPHILVRCLHVKDSNGRPIFLTALEAPTPGALGSILGFPVSPANVLPTTNTAGSKVAAFGDPDAYVVAPRQAGEFASSDQVYFANDQVGYRGIARAAFKGRLATGLAVLTLAAS